jgi:hypothetical protein
MAIIGFSLSPQDEYARQIIYSIVTNYQRAGLGVTALGMAKAPLTLVSYFAKEGDEKAFRQRYRFVDWNHTTLHGTGFDMGTLDSIFQ